MLLNFSDPQKSQSEDSQKTKRLTSNGVHCILVSVLPVVSAGCFERTSPVQFDFVKDHFLHENFAVRTFLWQHKNSSRCRYCLGCSGQVSMDFFTQPNLRGIQKCASRLCSQRGHSSFSSCTFVLGDGETSRNGKIWHFSSFLSPKCLKLFHIAPLRQEKKNKQQKVFDPNVSFIPRVSFNFVFL